MLRLRDRHAVTGDDDHLIGGGQNRRCFLGGGAVHRPGFRAGGGCGLHLAEGAEQDVGERPVHRLGHDDREDESGRAVERAGDDQELVVEHESHGGGGKSGVGVQQRDHRWHVRAADGDDHEHAEDQRNAHHQRKELLRLGMQDEINGAADGDGEQQEVDEVLSFIGDRALGQDLLELARRHQAAGEGQGAENHFHGKHRHHELRGRSAFRR